MATVLQECTTVKQNSVVCFYRQRVSMQRIFIKKCFLFTVGSVCSVKRFTTGWQTFCWWRRSRNGGVEVAETTVKRLLCCGFRRTGKAMGQVYQCWWRICREVNIVPRYEYHMFYFLYPFVACLLTLPRNLLTRITDVNEEKSYLKAPKLNFHLTYNARNSLNLCATVSLFRWTSAWICLYTV
jgi:hypothetical protein